MNSFADLPFDYSADPRDALTYCVMEKSVKKRMYASTSVCDCSNALASR